MKLLRTAPLVLLLLLTGCGGTHYDNCVSDLYDLYQKYGQNLPNYEPHPCTFLSNARYLKAQHEAYLETR